jgi:hypothetical protein
MGRLPTRPAGSCGPEYKLSNCASAHGLVNTAAAWKDTPHPTTFLLLLLFLGPEPQFYKGHFLNPTRCSQLDIVLNNGNTSPQREKESVPRAQHIRSAHGAPYRIVSDHT